MKKAGFRTLLIKRRARQVARPVTNPNKRRRPHSDRSDKPVQDNPGRSLNQGRAH